MGAKTQPLGQKRFTPPSAGFLRDHPSCSLQTLVGRNRGGSLRHLVVRGRKHRVFSALREDGSSPAIEMLALLQKGWWLPDSDHNDDEGWPDTRQADDRLKLLQQIQRFADTGTAAGRHQFNFLEMGIWEFKRTGKRISFYDTDGAGNYCTEKPNVREEDCSRPGDPQWWIPDFEPQLRLGHSFAKTGQKTERHDIEEAHIVREEDLTRDRAA